KLAHAPVVPTVVPLPGGDELRQRRPGLAPAEESQDERGIFPAGISVAQLLQEQGDALLGVREDGCRGEEVDRASLHGSLDVCAGQGEGVGVPWDVRGENSLLNQLELQRLEVERT